MKRQLQGIALILLSIFMILFDQFGPWSSSITEFAGYASVVIAIFGVVLVFEKP